MEGGVTSGYVGGYDEKEGNTVTKYYHFSGPWVAMREGDVVTYLHTDHPSASLRMGLGSTSLATTSGGALHSRQGYTPYGEVRYVTGELPTEFGFTGQRNESTIGLYDYHARWYDPSLGRFISADTIVPEPASPSDFNRYAYVRNSPLKYIDPSGHGPPDWLERVQGAFMQFANDMLLGAPTLVFGDAWQYNPSEAFQEGRELGRVASKVTGIALTVDGAKNTAAGLTAMVPTAGVGTACTAGTGGACGVPTVAALTAEAGLAVGGVLEAGWGIAVVNFAAENPLSGGGRSRRLTKSRKSAMKELNISKRQFNRAIHDIKGQVPGNPDMLFDLDTGDVLDQRSGEWVGNLFDY